MSVFETIKANSRLAVQNMAETGWTWSQRTSANDAAPSFAASAVSITAFPALYVTTVPIESDSERQVAEMSLRVDVGGMDTVPAIDDRVTDPDGTNWRIMQIENGTRASGTVQYRIRDETYKSLGPQRGRRE